MFFTKICAVWRRLVYGEAEAPTSKQLWEARFSIKEAKGGREFPPSSTWISYVPLFIKSNPCSPGWQTLFSLRSGKYIAENIFAPSRNVKVSFSPPGNMN